MSFRVAIKNRKKTPERKTGSNSRFVSGLECSNYLFHIGSIKAKGLVPWMIWGKGTFLNSSS